MLLNDILQEFTTAKLCTGPGKDAFIDKMPHKPDKCIVVSEYAGMPDMPWEESAVHRSVQVLCRASTATIAKAYATEVYDFIQSSLDEIGRIDFNGRFTQTSLRQTPFKLNEDQSNRVVYGFNMGVTTARD